MTTNYEIIIFWWREDQAFVAEVPDLDGCFAHGKSRREALENAEEAIQLWLDTAQEFGDPVLEPKGEKLKYA